MLVCRVRVFRYKKVKFTRPERDTVGHQGTWTVGITSAEGFADRFCIGKVTVPTLHISGCQVRYIPYLTHPLLVHADKAARNIPRRLTLRKGGSEIEN